MTTLEGTTYKVCWIDYSMCSRISKDDESIAAVKGSLSKKNFFFYEQSIKGMFSMRVKG